MNARAKAIFDEARASLNRIRDVKVEPRSCQDDDDALVQWRRGMPEREPSMTAAATAKMIGSALAQHQEIQREVAGKVIAHERQLHRAETDRLNRKLDELLSCFNNLLKATDALERSFSRDRGAEVIDLPALPLRNRRG
jgi:hypothetical protein